MTEDWLAQLLQKDPGEKAIVSRILVEFRHVNVFTNQEATLNLTVQSFNKGFLTLAQLIKY